MTINLPKLNQTGKNEWADVEDNDVALKEAIESVETEVEGISGITWYTPKVVATEQSRSSTEYGFLTTEDKVEGVKLAENGLLLIGYAAQVKSSVSAAGRIAYFLGTNQVKFPAEPEPTGYEVATSGTSFAFYASCANGIQRTAVASMGAPATTGQILTASNDSSAAGGSGGFCVVFAAAGTYTVGVKYKATSGSVTAKERKLWVAALG